MSTRRSTVTGLASAVSLVGVTGRNAFGRTDILGYSSTGPASNRSVSVQVPTNCTPGTLARTEGPFYTPNTPRRDNLTETDHKGELLILEGLVLSSKCEPIAGAVVDIWHCDPQGRYDNSGFKYRGHQFTDSSGAYRFLTFRSGEYSGRTPHIHVKVQGEGTRLLTTQLYFPDLRMRNFVDGIYREELLLDLSKEGDSWRGQFNLVVEAS